MAAEKSKCPRPVFLYCGGSNGPFGSAFPERKCCTMEIEPLENKRTCLAGQRSFQSLPKSEWKDTSKRTHSSRLTSLSGVLCLLVFLKVGTSNSEMAIAPSLGDRAAVRLRFPLASLHQTKRCNSTNMEELQFRPAPQSAARSRREGSPRSGCQRGWLP